ncbi:Rv3235 family protein [Homoserinimonas sp. OAct 916]|uniref:Rv3235 family protein n=1 Tax=Homoserinimonas sp. OAct 916 TaxID=2211450 RepID=UPI0034CE371C
MSLPEHRHRTPGSPRPGQQRLWPQPPAGQTALHSTRQGLRSSGSQSTGTRGAETDEFFCEQPTSTAALPPPGPLLENLTRCVMEVLAGARDINQLARWVDDEVYRHLLTRVVLAARARAMKGQQAMRPSFTLGRTTTFSPCDGVVEAVVTVHSRVRSRAVALRLEGLDGRWRATAINVL